MKHKSARLFSTRPCLTLGTRVKEVLPGGYKIADILLFDPVEEELVTVPNKKIPKELMDEEMVGASHGWGFFLCSARSFRTHQRLIQSIGIQIKPHHDYSASAYCSVL